MKKTQIFTVWLLPIIVIGGIFLPQLGYLVAAMMAILLTMSYFRGRYWCAHFCPRGAFLDIVVSKISFKKTAPKVMARQWFRWLVLILLVSFLIWRIIQTGGNLLAIGAVFVSMCIITTIIALILGITTRHRGWCSICPMGTLQEQIHKSNPRK
jgi:ferredoxin-type protein NapH